MSTKVLKNGTVITFDPTSQKIKVLAEASILITKDTISSISEDFASLPIPKDAEIIDVSGKIVSPGFINTHLHAWQTAYRSMGPDVTLVHYFDWVSQRSKLAQAAFTPEDIYISCLEGYLEGLNGGVTSFVDHAHNNWDARIMERGFDAAVDGGARVWWAYEPLDVEAFPAREQWEAYRRIAQKSRPETVSLAYSYNGLVGDELSQIIENLKQLDIKAITLHHLGGPWPAMNTSPNDLTKNGLTSLNIPIILSHAPYLTSSEISTLRSAKMHVSLTPESEFHYGHGQTTGHLIAPQASLGVDTNWTFSGDILTQARLWLQKVRDTGFQQHLQTTGTLPRNTPFTAEQAFLLATRQGGRALWRDDIGVLRAGAKADVVVFNGDSPNMLGWSNAVAAVMLHANVGDVEHVLVNGEFRKQDFRLVNCKMDWRELREKFVRTAKKVQTSAFPAPPVMENLWGFKATGSVEEWSTIEGENGK